MELFVLVDWPAFVSTTFAQAPAAGGGAGAGQGPTGVEMFMQFGPLLLIFFVMTYLLIYRPQMKQQQEQAAMLKALKKNDRVVTDGGIVGVITGQSSDGKELTIRTHEDTKLTLLRTAVRARLQESEPAEAKAS